MKKTNFLLRNFLLLSLILISFIYPQAKTDQDIDQETGLKQFSYTYTTEIGQNDQPGFELNPIIEKFALKLNSHLNQSPYFDTSFIVNTKKVRAHHLKPKHYHANVGILFNVKTNTNQIIRCTFFDRNSDKLMIVGAGFTNPREYMSPFIDMFPDHDVLLFDFRGHGYQEFKLGDINTWPMNLLEIVPGVNIDPNEVTLGQEEDHDVAAIVTAFKKRKTYTEVHGLGVCYGAFVFLKTAAQFPTIFDRLILDGCWLSLPLFVEKVRKDLKTIFNPQTGGWSTHWLFGNPKFIKNLEWSVVNIFGLKLHDLSLADYLHKITKTKILFFYGKDDLMVHRNEFEQIWNGLNVEKNVVITSNPHVRNHWKQKELYKLICDLFLHLEQKDFTNCLQNPHYLAQYQASLLTSTLEEKA